jgi:hypothetical protein
MRDFRVVQAKVSLRISSMVPVRGFDPPAILITGDSFNKAEEIVFNGIQVTEFLILGPNRLVAKIPDSQVGKALDSLFVLTSTSATHTDAALSLGITKPVKTVSGIDRLVQEWTMVFLTTPGSDIFDPAGGGGASSIVGKTADRNSASAALSQAVERTRQQITAKQARNSRIPPSERLLSASLVSVKFNVETTTLSAVVDLKSMVGSSALVTIG